MTGARGIAVFVLAALVWCGPVFADDTDPGLGPVLEPSFPDLEVDLSPPATELSDQMGLEPALKRALDAPDGFCKAEDYDLTRDEQRLCGLAEKAKARCPGFARAARPSGR